METKGQSRVLKAKKEVPKNDKKQGVGENKLSPASLKVTNKEMDPSKQSTKSTKKKSVVSKARSTYQRKLLGAQVKADEELARIMTIQLEMERKLVENRLALEKAKLEEEAEENIIEGNKESSSEDPKEKVGDWLRNIEQTDRKRMLYETSVEHYHEKNAHAGLQLSLNGIRQK
ncbi:hypothetical protein JTB14_022030 [Gonioctena quinquepunctata]|nr:hypothetical protein JTB14_022030 [Gonioctena quinquepunctata]